MLTAGQQAESYQLTAGQVACLPYYLLFGQDSQDFTSCLALNYAASDAQGNSDLLVPANWECLSYLQGMTSAQTVRPPFPSFCQHRPFHACAACLPS